MYLLREKFTFAEQFVAEQLTVEMDEKCEINVLPSAGMYDVAFGVSVNLNWFAQNEIVDSKCVRFRDVTWKLKFSRLCDEEGNINGYRCALMALASYTDDWSCSLNKHVLAWKSFDSLQTYYRQRPNNQYKVVNKRMLDGYVSRFLNVSSSGVGETEDEPPTFLEISIDEANLLADQNKWLNAEFYLRCVGPISLYPTYDENYDFGQAKCINLRVLEKGEAAVSFKAPIIQLLNESDRFKSLMRDQNNGSDEPIEIIVDCSALDVRSFLQCLLPPYMPVDKLSEETLKPVISLAIEYKCSRLLTHIQQYLIETKDFSPMIKIDIGNTFNMAAVVFYALQQITDVGAIASFMQTDDYRNLTFDTQILVMKRLGEEPES